MMEEGSARQRRSPDGASSHQQPQVLRQAKRRNSSIAELEAFGFQASGTGGDAASEGGWGAVSDLDEFFGSLYRFYEKRGLATVLVTGISNAVTLAFTVVFSTFLFAFVDWPMLWRCRDEKSCQPTFHDFLRNPWQSFGFFDAMVLFWFVLLAAYWAWSIAAFVASARQATKMAQLLHGKLGISPRELQTIEWHEVVSRLEALHKSGAYTVALATPHGRGLSPRDVACRIMRKDNFMIALLNKGVLPLRVPIPRWPPPCLTSFLMSFASMSDYASSTSSNAAQGYRHPSDYQHPPASHSSGGGVSVGGIGGGGNANNHNNSSSGNNSNNSNSCYNSNSGNNSGNNSNSGNSNNSNDEFMAASVGGTQYGGLPDDVVLGGWCRLSRRSYFTKTLEWALHLCLFDQMLNRKDFKVRKDFLKDSAGLKRRFWLTGAVCLALLPFVLVFMAVHFFLKHAQEWRSNKNYLGPRQWDHLALWHFREFNELPHVFERRIAKSYAPAAAYVKRFYSPSVAVASRGIAFIAGALVGVLVLITVIDDDAFLFHVTLGDHNLLWHLGVLSAIYATAWSLAGDGRAPPEVFDDADGAMHLVAEQTHYFPEQWRGKCASLSVRDEFLSIFKFKAALFGEEVLVVLAAPYLLMVALPSAAEDILAFIRDYTVDVEGIGSVCGFSLFDFERFGDERFAAPKKSPTATATTTNDEDSKSKLPPPPRRRMRSEQGKMEKSFLNFKINHPDWQCGPSGNHFIEKLCAFQEDEVLTRQEEAARHTLDNLAASASLLSASMHRQQNLGASGSSATPAAAAAAAATGEMRPPRPAGIYAGGTSSSSAYAGGGGSSVNGAPGHFAPIPEKSSVGEAAGGNENEESSGSSVGGGGGGGVGSGGDRGNAGGQRHRGGGVDLLVDLEADLGLSAVLAAVQNGTLPSPRGGAGGGYGQQSALLGRSSHLFAGGGGGGGMGRSALGRSSMMLHQHHPGASSSSTLFGAPTTPRTVDSILQQALREESQSVLLRSTLQHHQPQQQHGCSSQHGGPTFLGTSSIGGLGGGDGGVISSSYRPTTTAKGAEAEAQLEASFYWLDKFRSQQQPQQQPAPGQQGYSLPSHNPSRQQHFQSPPPPPPCASPVVAPHVEDVDSEPLLPVSPPLPGANSTPAVPHHSSTSTTVNPLVAGNNNKAPLSQPLVQFPFPGQPIAPPQPMATPQPPVSAAAFYEETHHEDAEEEAEPAFGGASNEEEDPSTSV